MSEPKASKSKAGRPTAIPANGKTHVKNKWQYDFDCLLFFPDGTGLQPNLHLSTFVWMGFNNPDCSSCCCTDLT